jgi:hypothetical protein
MKCSQNLIEYEKLKSQTLKISQVSQKILNIAIAADLYERSKQADLVNQKLQELNFK